MKAFTIGSAPIRRSSSEASFGSKSRPSATCLTSSLPSYTVGQVRASVKDCHG
jgi:hypothetical protein